MNVHQAAEGFASASRSTRSPRRRANPGHGGLQQFQAFPALFRRKPAKQRLQADVAAFGDRRDARDQLVRGPSREQTGLAQHRGIGQAFER